jgi:hypothetical protein
MPNYRCSKIVKSFYIVPLERDEYRHNNKVINSSSKKKKFVTRCTVRQLYSSITLINIRLCVNLEGARGCRGRDRMECSSGEECHGHDRMECSSGEEYHGHDRIVVGFTTACAISADHH